MGIVMKNSDVEKELKKFLIYDFLFCFIAFIYFVFTSNISVFIFSIIMLIVDIFHLLFVREKLKGE